MVRHFCNSQVFLANNASKRLAIANDRPLFAMLASTKKEVLVRLNLVTALSISSGMLWIFNCLLCISSQRYSSINKNLKTHLQAAQNKCIRFCLKLNDRSSMKSKDFEKIDWLQIHKRVSQCSLWSIYKLFTKKCHKKFDEIYAPIKTIKFTWGSLYQKLTLYQKLNVSHRKTNIGQKVLHYVGPSI